MAHVSIMNPRGKLGLALGAGAGSVERVSPRLPVPLRGDPQPNLCVSPIVDSCLRRRISHNRPLARAASILVCWSLQCIIAVPGRLRAFCESPHLAQRCLSVIDGSPRAEVRSTLSEPVLPDRAASLSLYTGSSAKPYRQPMRFCWSGTGTAGRPRSQRSKQLGGIRVSLSASRSEDWRTLALRAIRSFRGLP
jgi:hypothetical protein